MIDTLNFNWKMGRGMNREFAKAQAITWENVLNLSAMLGRGMHIK